MALVGSCRPTTRTFRVVFVSCLKPGCAFRASTMSERAAIAALNEHLSYERHVDRVLPIAPFTTGEPDAR